MVPKAMTGTRTQGINLRDVYGHDGDLDGGIDDNDQLEAAADDSDSNVATEEANINNDLI